MTSPTSRLAIALLAALPISSMAAMGSVATNFGLTPADTASAQALSMFSNQPSAVYYNPAYLARDRRGALSAGFLFTEQDLTVKGFGTPDTIIASGDTAEDSSNYNVLLGLKTDLSTMLTSNRAMVLGFQLGAERTGERLLSFKSTTSQVGQSLRYGQQSLFLSVGAGLNVIPGFDVGAAARITLAAEAQLGAEARLNGETSGEGLTVSAKPSIQPILSANLNWGELICPEDKYCGWNGLETALTYRYESDFTTNVTADATVVNAVSQLPLLIRTLDSYQPEMFSAGIQYNFYKIRLAASADYQLWSGLNDKLRNDTVKDQAQLRFKDTLVPRAGFELRLDNTFSIIGGVSYEESPLESSSSLNVNYVDNDRVVVGLGFSYLIEKALFLSMPLRMDFGYQYHILADRDFLLVTDKGNGNQQGSEGSCTDGNQQVRCEQVTAGGNAHVLNASVNLAF